MTPASSNGYPTTGNGSGGPPGRGRASGDGEDPPGCLQLPGILLRLVFWSGLLVVVIWLVVVLLTSTR